MKKIIVTLVLVAGIVAGLAAFDGMNHGNWGQNRNQNGMMMNRPGWGDQTRLLCEKIELTDAQKDKIESLRLAHQKEMIQLDTEIKVLKLDQRAAMQNQDFAKAKKLIGKIYELKEKKELKKIEHFEAVWNELTPEQQEEAKNIQPERMHRNMMNNKMERQHRNWQDDED